MKITSLSPFAAYARSCPCRRDAHCRMYIFFTTGTGCNHLTPDTFSHRHAHGNACRNCCRSDDNGNDCNAHTFCHDFTTGLDCKYVAIKNLEFNPKTITVKSGTTVTWTNMDAGSPHGHVKDTISRLL